MSEPHDLEQLWKNQPVDAAVKGDQMRRIVLSRIEKFDRKIRRRNIRETAAAIAVAMFFTYAAWSQRNAFERAGSIIVAMSALWVIYYIWRLGAEPRDPNPDQTLAAYERALVRKCDHQIRLLRNVKLWYLLPFYAGLVISSVGMIREHAQRAALTWADAAFPLFYTLVFAAIWWLNEVYSVRRLRLWRARLISEIGEHDDGSEQ